MLDVKIIGRSAGQSSVASAAYRAGERLTDERQEKTHDYTKKQNIEGKEILAPQNAPAWVFDRGKLWNAVEKVEFRKDSQLAREVVASLPRELSFEQRQKLVKDFVQNEFVNKGMVADISWHNPKAADGGYNPHAHIMLTMRNISPEGFGQKNREWNTAVFTKYDQIKDKSQLVGLRASWANYVNDALNDSGSTTRVSHLSNEARGLNPIVDDTPSVAVHMHRRGAESDIYINSLRGRHDQRSNQAKAQFSNPRTAKQTRLTAYASGYDTLQKRQKSGIEPPDIGVASSAPVGYAQTYKANRKPDYGIDI